MQECEKNIICFTYMNNSSSINRILLKLSGEALLGKASFGIDQQACFQFAKRLACFYNSHIQLALVIGGGNIFRGIHINGQGVPRTPADHIGMLATLMNGIALREALLANDIPTVLMSALECPRVCDCFSFEKASDAMQKGHIVIFVGGTGNPYFTTDTAAALRSCEMKVDVMLKATKVDGVFDKDPLKYTDASKYSTITHSEVILKGLQVMDATSVALCKNNEIPILVFDMHRLYSETPEEIISHSTKGTWIMPNVTQKLGFGRRQSLGVESSQMS